MTVTNGKSAHVLVNASVRGKRTWGVVVAVGVLIALLWVYIEDKHAHVPGADGQYAFLYARSLVYDHDLDFTNDYLLCGDPQEIIDVRFGPRPINVSFIGPALYLAPVLWVARQIARPAPQAEEAELRGCRGPVVTATLAVGPFLGALTVFLGYCVARRFTRDGSAALAAAFFGFASMLTIYASVMPSYTHVYEAASAAIVLLLSVRAAERPESSWRWLLAGCGVGLAMLQRPNCIFFGIVPTTLALFAWRHRAAKLGIAVLLVAIGTAAVGIVPSCLLNKLLFGSYSPLASRDPHILQFAHPHPLLILFSPIGGLFYFTPVTWLSVIGIRPGLRDMRSRPFVAGALLAAAVQVYLCSAILDWYGGGSFGARRLTPIVPILIVLAALGIDRIATWMRKRKGRMETALAFAALLPPTFVVLGMAVGTEPGKTVVWDPALDQEDLYGRGAMAMWWRIDQSVGDLAILPAEFLYGLRYRLPMRTFRTACWPWYSRHTRLMYWKSNFPALSDPRLRETKVGLEDVGTGSRMTQDRARIVFGAEWPTATELTVTASASQASEVRIGFGHFFTPVDWLAPSALPGGDVPTKATLRVPRGAFDSGVNELVIESEGASQANIVLREIHLDDTTTYKEFYRTAKTAAGP